MATRSHVRVFSEDFSEKGRASLDQQINAEIEQGGYEVTAVSIAVNHGKFAALVAFRVAARTN